MPIQPITPFLWFHDQAEEAAELYTSVFPNSKITKIVRYGKTGPGPEGSVMTVEFELMGQKFVGLNGNPRFASTEAVSFLVNCETQAEVDAYWEKLTAEGAEVACGWLKDKFGLAWQICPTVLLKFISDPDQEKAGRAMKAMMTMKKLDIAVLERAYDGTD